MKKLLISLLFVSTACFAWPTKEITIIVPYLPGGVTDQLARTMQNDLESELKVPVRIKNLPGAANSAALNHLLLEEFDNHTFLYTIDDLIPGQMFLPADGKRYEHLKAVTITGTVPFLVVGKKDFDLTKFKAQIKNKQRVSIANAGINGGADIWIRNLTSNIEFLTVPYKGTPPMINDVVAGHVDYAVLSQTGTYQFVQEGKLNAIMVSTETRNSKLKDTPTFRELGFTGDSAEVWFGILTRKDTSKQATEKFSEAVRRSVRNNPAFKTFENKGMNLVNMSVDDSERFFQKEIARFSRSKVYQ